MPSIHRLVQPGKSGNPRIIRTAEGYPLEVPAGWELLPPGDAMLTRRVKVAGECWVMQERKGRRMMSRGVWAPADRIVQIRAEVEVARADPAYRKKLNADRNQRDAKQETYARDFEAAIVSFLDFARCHQDLAERLAKDIADHAVPVGSGTVARTQRISIEERARAAVIAWMRHHTTDYDRMKIPHIKGRRREVRRQLARQSLARLKPYRTNTLVPHDCPLQAAVNSDA